MDNKFKYSSLNPEWFFGIVEDRNDPLNLGRVRVRIFGRHSDNKQLIPTESLPWAQILLPTNNPNPYPSKEGDSVLGMFLDGKNAIFQRQECHQFLLHDQILIHKHYYMVEQQHNLKKVLLVFFLILLMKQ